VPKEEADLVGDLRYAWRSLKKVAAEVSEQLASVQVTVLVLEGQAGAVLHRLPLDSCKGRVGPGAGWQGRQLLRTWPPLPPGG
jgi:hypothetical protein